MPERTPAIFFGHGNPMNALQSNAYTQAALTELMRLRAIDLAATGAEMKLDAQYGAQLRTNINDALKRR